MKTLCEIIGTWFSDKMSAAVGMPTQEELQKLRTRILTFSAVIPLINIGNFIYQCFGHSTNGLKIESFLLIVFSVIFVVNFFLQDKNDMNVTRFIGLTKNVSSLYFPCEKSLILSTNISTGEDLWIAVFVLIVLSVIEFGIRCYFAKICWSLFAVEVLISK
ncbi:hypothetical protein PRIPAC_74049 [Pristionchus pacificus]|uniref:Uncharacterized protein n=1 Tax=Pristionchus pacificus TaxID=54126 RepID=A0A2A6D029_PRIPA|nr:hypothetical protein PRIPAC_74049 [Pristionchus pacificus]|eukprot:PDM83631.1 hypothetical protein PRIPAC_30118 [Pristionchus pacificus]